ncbi:MAG: Gfo/Idh/MocA family protein [Candidatus Binataceae bacterium]
MSRLRVGVIGCGLIGARRAADAATHLQTKLVKVADTDSSRANSLAQKFGCEASADSAALIEDRAIDIVVISTPNGFTASLALSALKCGKNVLIEKPPGRNLAETMNLAEAARRAAPRILKVGFNHRYHPAISRAHRMYRQGAIGEAINLRARYGHGGRPGYEKEWRGNPEQAGGGELIDQGVHIADLINWFLGRPESAFSMLQTAVWPIAPLEDNAFALLRFSSGAIASVHTSWTQWKNLFSFELFGRLGSLCVEGLAGSYGNQRLIISLRKPEGGAPEMVEEAFEGPDSSWTLEWRDFVRAILDPRDYLGTPEEGVAAMATVDALYRSARAGVPVPILQ